MTSSADDFSTLSQRAKALGDNSISPPIADKNDLTVKSGALDRMMEFAQQHGSYTLSVLHKGIIQLDGYAPG